MAVTVRPHENMSGNFRRYARALPGSRAEQTKTAGERWQEFVAGITAAGGPTEGAVPDARFPSSYWCSFPGGFLVLVYFPPPRRTGLFGSVIEALAIEMNLSPGLPD